ncbi:CBS domain-containing protein [Congregibacter brevis]|uniref:CBS domain-containing protein n=1 Tax=Congregibacter brevis TaxID=3081201 RepID=A0ABZ0IB49_9GAMM|nr:CBS domain-containing protein [Congregibacter sp. IMCC45268]
MPAPNTIKDCMRRNPLTINCNSNLVQAVETLVEYKLTGVTVVDDDGNPVGVLSELDCIQSVLNAIYNDGDPEHALVQDAMTSSIVSCTPGDSIVEVAADMLATRQRRRPVIENGRLVGQVSSSNVLWALMENSRRRVNSKGV